MDKPTKQYLAETEVIFRDVNENVADFIVEEEGPDTDTTLPFYCECSNLHCRTRIRITPEVYKLHHKNKRQFMIIPGHDIAEIEDVVERDKEFQIIEKFGDPPDRDSISRALEKLNLD